MLGIVRLQVRIPVNDRASTTLVGLLISRYHDTKTKITICNAIREVAPEYLGN